MGAMKLAGKITTVGQLREALAALPADARLIIRASVLTDQGPDTVSGTIVAIEHRTTGQANTTSHAERVVICT